MNDVFKEQMVKKQPSTKDMLIKTGVIILALIIVSVSAVFLPQLMAIFFLICGFGVWYLFGMLNIEYEYVLTNGELDIDVIYAKSRRKRVFSGELRSFEIMCHVSENGYDGDFNSAKLVKDYSKNKPSDSTYKFLTTYKDNKIKITFDPNEEILKAMLPYLGQRKFIKKNR